MTSEKSFEAYFAKTCESYRMALINGNGFPDRLILRGTEHWLLELKILTLGKRGDRMLRGLYKPTQMPWHLDYLVNKKGKRLYTLFKLEGKYGLVHETPEYCHAVLDGLKYSGLKDFDYKEVKILRHVVEELLGE